MSVWLTPDLKPVVGGTYFPPDDRYYGTPGFKSILLTIAEKVHLLTFVIYLMSNKNQGLMYLLSNSPFGLCKAAMVMCSAI